jgi:predicted Zn-dependent protease
MVPFMGSEGEFAFLVSHEIGHAVDDACKTPPRTGRLASVRRRSRLDVLLGGNRVAAQRKCETRADAIGFNIFRAAGYNPFDAAGAFGRLEMYLGDTSTGILARLNAVRSDHPMTPDRIKHMRSLLMAEENAQTAVSETPQ